MRVLGVDPGTITVGFGILEETNGSYQTIDFGCIKLSSKELFANRLKKIYDGLTEIIDQYRPDEFAIEDLFYAENVKVALKMGHARGVAILAAVNHRVPSSEYSPREIKQSVVGNGAASKQQVQRMVKQLLGLQILPEPFDVSDALAVALCHIHRRDRKI